MKSYRWATFPIYPWMLAVCGILFVFDGLIGKVIEQEVAIALEAAFICVGLLFLIVLLASRDVDLAGAIVGVSVLMLILFGAAANLPGMEHNRVLIGMLCAVLAAMLMISILYVADGMVLQRIALVGNAVGAALLVIAAWPVLTYYWPGAQRAHASETETGNHPTRLDSTSYPDIYYIVLDGYSGGEFLQHDFGYDNSAFTDALENRGFYVAYDSKTAYAITVPSLFSTLNMRYINDQDKRNAEKTPGINGAPQDITYLRTGIADSFVSQDLQRRGYTYIFMLSGYDVPSSTADMNVDFHRSGVVYYTGTNEETTGTYDPTLFSQVRFIPVLFSRMGLRPSIQKIDGTREIPDDPYDFREPLRALATWDEAEKIADYPQATFAVIHIIKPHEPVIFDREGHIVRPAATTKNSTREELSRRFFEQLEFVNARTLRMIDTIDANSSVPPIFIIQGDHGSVYGNPRSAQGKRTNFGILNAYRFPGRDCEGLTPDIIPINSFRVLLNCEFGAPYPLLESKYYDVVIGYGDLFRVAPMDIKAWEAQHEGETP